MYLLLQICEQMMERDAHMYFRCRLNRWGVELYREHYGRDNGPLQFKIDLPFIHIRNVSYRKQAFDGHGGFKDIPVTSGKVLFWKIKI